MRTKRVNRYYCDFCRKAGQSKYWISKHERGCTANPGRICGLCEHSENEQKPIAELVACISAAKDDCGIKDVSELSNHCPACTLAAIRQSGILKVEGGDGFPISVPYDFKADMARFWSEQNDAKVEIAW